jgi:hypothetical protein
MALLITVWKLYRRRRIVTGQTPWFSSRIELQKYETKNGDLVLTALIKDAKVTSELYYSKFIICGQPS